jgi:hypothetical protein
MTAQQLVDKLMGQFDVDQTTALQILNEAHKRAVADSEFRMSTVSLGNTVANQANYSLSSGIVTLRRVRIYDGSGYTTYDPVDISALWDLDAGNATADGEVFALDADTSGTLQIRLYPAPTTGGLAITGLQTLEPADLTYGVNEPIIPADFHMSLLYELAQALAYSQVDERDDQAAAHFTAAAAEIPRLTGRKNARTTTDRSRLAVFGHDFR